MKVIQKDVYSSLSHSNTLQFQWYLGNPTHINIFAARIKVSRYISLNTPHQKKIGLVRASPAMVISLATEKIQLTTLVTVFSLHIPTDLLFYCLLPFKYYFSFFFYYIFFPTLGQRKNKHIYEIIHFIYCCEIVENYYSLLFSCKFTHTSCVYIAMHVEEKININIKPQSVTNINIKPQFTTISLYIQTFTANFIFKKSPIFLQEIKQKFSKASKPKSSKTHEI